MTKTCSICGQPFTATHSHNQYCSRACFYRRAHIPIGSRWGRVTVIGFSHWQPRPNGFKAAHMRVQCDCGTIFTVQRTTLKNGRTKSCGCWHREQAARNGHATWRHGLANTPEWNSYHAAKARCNNPNNHRYSDWGGRGIEFRFTSFEQWLKVLGPKPSPEHSIDRIDNDGHYEPGNVRWGSQDEQRANKRPRRWAKHPERIRDD